MALIVVIAVSCIRPITSDPASLFETEKNEITDLSLQVTAEPVQSPGALVSSTPEPTLDPYAQLQSQADLSMMKNIVNVMLIGVDYATERDTWKGKDGQTASHADVMIVLSIDFDHNKASLISLPRDTYAKIPGVDGIYKLNAALDCGGGFNAANGSGYKKVCEAASRMIGGLPINYYYAVTMQAVKDLVNEIGGVDFDLDVSFKLNGRSYKKGVQHMDGQAVLDYLRVRKSQSGLSSSQTGDSNRVNRQKKMLIAIFEKIKSENLMTSIPSLLNSFSGQLFTNCSLSQTAALALYGYSMPSENISSYSMSGPMKNLYTWNFCFPDPANRRKIINEVYGIDASTLLDCTKEYATWEYQSRYAEQALNTCNGLTSHINDVTDYGSSFMGSKVSSMPAEAVYLSAGLPARGSVLLSPFRTVLLRNNLFDNDTIIIGGEGEEVEEGVPPQEEPPHQDDVIIIDGNDEDPFFEEYSYSAESETFSDYSQAVLNLEELLNTSRNYAKKYLNGGSGGGGGSVGWAMQRGILASLGSDLAEAEKLVKHPQAAVLVKRLKARFDALVEAHSKALAKKAAKSKK